MTISDAILSARTLAGSTYGLNAAKDKLASPDDESAALRKFDALFLGNILKGFQTEDEDSLFDGGSAGRMYRDHFYEEIARVIAEKGGLGLSEQLQGQLDKTNGGEGPDASAAKKSSGGTE